MTAGGRPPAVRVAPVDLRDGPSVVALLRVQRAAYAVEAQLIGSDAIPALHEDATALAASGESVLGAFAAAAPVGGDDGTLVGALGYVRRAATVEIHRLVVDPAAFRRGVAGALLDAAGAAEPGATDWRVATGSANAPALALYARRGFRVTGTRTAAGGVALSDLRAPRP